MLPSADPRREGHWDESLASREPALSWVRVTGAFVDDAASTYAMLRQFPTALKFHDRALDIVPNDPELMAAKAVIYQAGGNLQQAAGFLSEVNAQTSSSFAFGTKMTQLRLERNHGEVVRLLQTRLAQFHYGSEFEKAGNQISLAFAQRLAGNSAGPNISVEQARDTLEPLSKIQPDNALFVAVLSQAYALLGDQDTALKDARRAIWLVPSAKDALSGPGYEESLALIEVICGEK